MKVPLQAASDLLLHAHLQYETVPLIQDVLAVHCLQHLSAGQLVALRSTCRLNLIDSLPHLLLVSLLVSNDWDAAASDIAMCMICHMQTDVFRKCLIVQLKQSQNDHTTCRRGPQPKKYHKPCYSKGLSSDTGSDSPPSYSGVALVAIFMTKGWTWASQVYCAWALPPRLVIMFCALKGMSCFMIHAEQCKDWWMAVPKKHGLELQGTS